MADKALNLQSIVCSEDESLEYNKKSCKKENSALKKKIETGFEKNAKSC